MQKVYEVLVIEDNDQRHKHSVISDTPLTDEQVHLEALRWFERHFGTARSIDATTHITKRPK